MATRSVIAADMLAQAEHDPDASAMLFTTSETLAEAVSAEIERQLATLANRRYRAPIDRRQQPHHVVFAGYGHGRIAGRTCLRRNISACTIRRCFPRS